jgi:pimeloyl-ACP methyl ester carboxylesterase
MAFQDSAGVVAVQSVPGMPIRIAANFGSGRAGALLADKGDTARLVYIEGGGRRPSPERYLVSERAGAIQLEVSTGASPRTLREIPLYEEQVKVSNGEVSLAGVFVRPAAPGKYPVVLFLHGSGASNRGVFPTWGALLAANGIASFSFDKRGTGSSTGNWQLSTLRELAADGQAIVMALRHRADVNPEKVALLGTSQGPWIQVIMAAADPQIAALVFSSGGGVTGAAQEVYRRTNLAASNGATPAEQDIVRDFLTRYFRFLATEGRESAGISEFWAKYGSARWFASLNLPASDPTVGEWPPARKVFAKDLAIDYPALHKQIRQPVLQLLARADENVPAELAAETLRRELPDGRGKQLEVLIVRDADHRFELPATSPDDIPLRHPAYFPRIVTFLKSQLLRPPH